MQKSEVGISIYFRDDCIRFWKQTIIALNEPEYIHLYIVKDKKQLFIRRAEAADDSSFKVTADLENPDWRYKIVFRQLIIYLATIVGVAYQSESLFFPGTLMADGKTVYINLKNYRIIPYDRNVYL